MITSLFITWSDVLLSSLYPRIGYAATHIPNALLNSMYGADVSTIPVFLTIKSSSFYNVNHK